MITRAFAVRAAALYVPLCAAVLAHAFLPRRRRMGAAVMLGVLWTLPSLLAVQALNRHAGWWSFTGFGPALRGMPVELFLGWCCLWGALPILLLSRMRAGWVVVLFGALDVVVMPLCSPVVRLSRGWLEGDAVALVVVLTPSVILARWTLEDRCLRWRAAMQVLLSGAIFLWLLPEIAFALRSGGWGRLPRGAGLGVLAQALCLLALPGVSAVQEFCLRGGGTPIPQDPPKRLVVSGIYRYVANPMQCSCMLVMLLWGAALRNGWVVAIGVMAAIYSAGIARWDEHEDLRERFGERWVRYRTEVHDWRWRWRPYLDAESTLYISESCGMCGEVRRWFVARGVMGLRIVAAEDYPGQPLLRMRYVSADGGVRDDGVRAFARGLEHIHLGWAVAGMALRLPVVAAVVQLIADASGMGPRNAQGKNRSGSSALRRVTNNKRKGEVGAQDVRLAQCVPPADDGGADLWR